MPVHFQSRTLVSQAYVPFCYHQWVTNLRDSRITFSERSSVGVSVRCNIYTSGRKRNLFAVGIRQEVQEAFIVLQVVDEISLAYENAIYFAISGDCHIFGVQQQCVCVFFPFFHFRGNCSSKLPTNRKTISTKQIV